MRWIIIFVSYNKKYFRPTKMLRRVSFINILEAMSMNATILGQVLVVSHAFLKFKNKLAINFQMQLKEIRVIKILD